MFDVGDSVEISGLQSKPEWNGKTGTIINAFNWEKGRYPVSILVTADNSNDALLKPSNLKLIKKHTNEEEKGNANATDESPYFELVLTEQKGIGMIAARDIDAGTVILNDEPLLSIPRTQNKDTQQKQQCIVEQFKSLSDEKKQKVLSYHTQIDEEQHPEAKSTDGDKQHVLGIYFTNAYTIVSEEADIASGFFPNIARMNHSCLSNCEVLPYDSASHSRSVVALFDIKKGEELTIYYIGNTYYSLSMTHKERSAYIADNFNFECKCAFCMEVDAKMERFREEFAKYQEMIDEKVNHFNTAAFKAVLSASTQMINIVNKAFRGYPTILSQCYMNAAHALVFMKQYEKCLKYLRKSVQIDTTFYRDKAVFDDVEECLAKIPRKYQQQYPWDHVLNLE